MLQRDGVKTGKEAVMGAKDCFEGLVQSLDWVGESRGEYFVVDMILGRALARVWRPQVGEGECS